MSAVSAQETDAWPCDLLVFQTVFRLQLSHRAGLLSLSVLAGETGGLRVPRAGLDPQKRPCWLVQSAVFCSAKPQLHGSRSHAEEADETVPVVRLTGADALEKAAFLKPIRREEKYMKSSLQALHDPAPPGDAQRCVSNLLQHVRPCADSTEL